MGEGRRRGGREGSREKYIAQLKTILKKEDMELLYILLVIDNDSFPHMIKLVNLEKCE